VSWFVFILAVLAGARTWRLLAVDGIAFRVRNGVDQIGWPMLSEGWYCPFCLGFWVTSAWLLTGYLVGDTAAWLVTAGCFAASYAQAQLNAWLDVHPITEGGGEIGDDTSE
jgi:hypothetical protein